MSDSTFDLVPTLLTFTPRLLSSLVLAGLWRWVSSPFIIAGLFVLSWLSGKWMGTKEASPAPASPVSRGRSGRPGFNDASERSGSTSGGSTHSLSDSDSSSSTADHRLAFPGLDRRTKRWLTMLGGPGSRRANLLNAVINLVFFAAVLQRTQPLQMLLAEPGCFSVQTIASTDGITFETRMGQSSRCLQSIGSSPLMLQVLPKDASDIERAQVLDVSSLQANRETTITINGLSPGTAYRTHIAQNDHVHHVGVARTALVDQILPDGRCALGLHAFGQGLSTRERIHNFFGQTLCGPAGGKSLLYQFDTFKAYVHARYTNVLSGI